ncbi:uncharacterized protein JN550_008068 [Neoarthrinium moseri]|uniref:uncharacterized protein n=1 Tax=Neoarthrinium moseri TaxID=1658444 RepID=UPI001FDDB0B0|nr:uncharacterized protein JN550_008068 [Neoarthrinium moseri]KAI1865810.1 hypothetical protein JN550_008068 [Neoarthrinium moseri]
MPPRLSLLDAARQSVSLIRTQACQFSQTASSLAIRRDLRSSTARLMDLDSSSPSSSSTSPQQQQQQSPRSQPTSAAENVFTIFQRDRNNRRNGGGVAGEQRVGGASSTASELRSKNTAEEYMRQMPRRFNIGDLYAPHDLSPVEAAKHRKITTVQRDLVDLLGLRPQDMYRNFSFISEFITPHGRIKKSYYTGLRPVNQRKLAKAIRRAVGQGLHPSVHKHPEILMRQRNVAGAQTMATGSLGNHYKV